MIPLSSDPRTLLEADLDAACAALMDDEHVLPHPSYLQLSPIGEISIASTAFPKPSSRRLEEPLLPAAHHNISSPPAIDVEELFKGLGPSHDTVFGACSEAHEKASDPLEDALADSFLEDAALAAKSVEQEQLDLRSTAVRLPVPIMDFSIPEAPWERRVMDEKGHLAFIGESNGGFSLPLCPRVASEESQLRWNPFPSRLGHVSHEEAPDGDSVTSQLLDMQDPADLPDSSAYVWKQPGISILKGVWDDEELDLGQQIEVPGQANDLKHLVDMRRSALEMGNPSESSVSPIDLIRYPKAHADLIRKPLLSKVDDASRSSALLSNFVAWRTSRQTKGEKSQHFKKPAPTRISPSPSDNATRTPIITSNHEGPKSNSDVSKPAPFPFIQANDTRKSIITTLTLSRGVQSWIERLLPSVKMIERDFSRWNTLTWERNSVSRSPIISPLAAEADILVSSGTGVVITSVIQAIQKPLPGQDGKAAIRERIEKVSLRYERLVVLVSQANRFDESMRELSEGESVAFSEFSGFVAGLEGITQVYYIGGGEETLSRWLAYFIDKHSPRTDQVGGVLNEDETTWEVFLRRVGLNAYAAQTVLAMLKAPEDTPGADIGRHGLAAFINMTHTERVQMFGPLLGGEQVLRRVGMTLHSGWA